MRSVPAALSDHLSGPVTALATCWRIQRRDGVLIALTSHDRDIRFEGVAYKADGGLSASAMKERNDLSIDNLEINGVLSSSALPARDLMEGRFDGARVEIFLVNWLDPTAGRVLIKRGTLGRIGQIGTSFQAEVRGLTDALSRKITEEFSPGCRAELGDKRCKRSLRAFERVVEVQSVISDVAFEVNLSGDPDGWYDFGRIVWHLGANGGLISEITRFDAGRIYLFRAPPNMIAAGDLFTIRTGCDKRLATCRDKFDNVENFRGDPFIPGLDSIIDYPGVRGN